jgi:gluconokinase
VALAGPGGVSALKQVYRDRIRTGAGGRVQFVHLAGSREVIATRMAARKGHYMPASLLDSQFAALEAPGAEEAVTVDIDQPLEAIIAAVLPQLMKEAT